MYANKDNTSGFLGELKSLTSCAAFIWLVNPIYTHNNSHVALNGNCNKMGLHCHLLHDHK